MEKNEVEVMVHLVGRTGVAQHSLLLSFDISSNTCSLPVYLYLIQ
jgi:hypothetical protein